LEVTSANEGDAAAIATIRTAVAERLTERYGRGHWSSCVTDKSVLRGLKASRVLVAREKGRVAGTVRLATTKPWAIDTKYFSTVQKPIYLHDLAVAPELQGQGIGGLLVEEAKAVAAAWPGDAIRLDAYDHAAGAGESYARCGFREVGRVTYRGVRLRHFELLLSTRPAPDARIR
jgi:GNAT superfamily N-acetyltransferase